MSWSRPLQRFKNLVSKVGGETFLDPKALLFGLAPIAVFSSILSSEIAKPIDLLIWLVSNLLAILATWPVVELLRAVKTRVTRLANLRIGPVIVISAFLGSWKAFFTVVFAATFFESDLVDFELAARTISGAMSGGIGIPLLSLAALARVEFENERQTLIHLQIKQEQIRLAKQNESRSLATLSKEISQLIAKINLKNKSALLPSTQINLLRQLVDNHVRPLTSSLMLEYQQRTPIFSWGLLAKSAIQDSLQPALVALIYFSSAPRYVEWLGFGQGLGRAVIATGAVYLAVLLVGKLPAKSRMARTFRFVLGNSVAPVLALWSLDLLIGPIAESPQMLLFLVGPWLLATATLFSIATVAFRWSNRNREQLAEILGVAEQEIDSETQRHARERQQRASQLHGEVQSRLMAIVLQQTAGQEVRSDVAVRELKYVAGLISSPIPEPADFDSALANLEEIWRGFATVGKQIDPGAASMINQQSAIAVIEEALSNSFRHGMAEVVEIKLYQHEGKVVLRVLDDGIGLAQGKAGSGTGIFNTCCESWELSPGKHGGSELIAIFKPLAHSV